MAPIRTRSGLPIEVITLERRSGRELRRVGGKDLSEVAAVTGTHLGPVGRRIVRRVAVVVDPDDVDQVLDRAHLVDEGCRGHRGVAMAARRGAGDRA